MFYLLDFLKLKIKYTLFHFIILSIKNFFYIKKEIAFHKNFLNKNNLIFDLGANVGDKSYVFSLFAKKIIAYEPEERLVNYLKRRFLKNKKIKIVPKVLSANRKKVKFYSFINSEAYSTIEKKSLDYFLNRKVKTNIVKKNIKSTTLNYEIIKFGTPDYVKIDCEGAEKLILKNLKFKIPIISFELNLPDFYDDGVKIISNLKKKFNSRFNIRLNDSFRFKNNIEHKKCLKFISKSKQSIEVFAFS